MNHGFILSQCEKKSCDDFFFLLFLKELLDSLHERYEEWLIKKSKFHVPTPVVVSVAGMECIDMYNIKKIVQRELCVIAQAGGVSIRLASSVLNLPGWQVEVL